MPVRTYNFTFASGATASNKQYIGTNRQLIMVVSAATGWNAGSGNASISVRTCAQSNFTTTAPTGFTDLPSMSVSTTPLLASYVLPYSVGGWMQLGFGTAVTGSTAANNIDVIVLSENN